MALIWIGVASPGEAGGAIRQSDERAQAEDAACVRRELSELQCVATGRDPFRSAHGISVIPNVVKSLYRIRALWQKGLAARRNADCG